MVLGKFCQVIVPAAMDAYEGDLPGAEFLELDAVADGDEPVAGAMNNVNGTAHFPYPLIGA
jgi:hypothetical protein